MKCKQCNLEKEVSKPVAGEYCSRRCYEMWRYHNTDRGELLKKRSHEYYEKVKNTPEFKAKAPTRKAKWDKWRTENKEHYNELVREANRVHQAKIRAYRKENDLCTLCGNKRDIDGRKNCRACLDKQGAWKKASAMKKNEKTKQKEQTN